ncbi:hypothetical protein KY290_032527 [Solanum tuberosum]|uniref:Uncharacterized protein n=1 Tax=Solanum tuberosum TaxID=4113 RepID=A0ABQ7UCF4_SOLTU|nr:hypothetical protein KY284_031937 [Solanum tuberosum]KAH0654651.1 hypothetical protein KY289_032329 [Solanum tuberosum]KAH0656864.1 hypothetical protein KY285_031746 [Solanum tuberosum]KAH0744534.1 hypothetical protein KY290_032527 [Solanum tuberosum]
MFLQLPFSLLPSSLLLPPPCRHEYVIFVPFNSAFFLLLLWLTVTVVGVLSGWNVGDLVELDIEYRSSLLALKICVKPNTRK